MKMRPLNDWVLIQPITTEEKSPGGIVIPDSAKESPSKGEVLAVGPGRFEEEGDTKAKRKKEKKFIKTEVKPGQKVLFRRFGVEEIQVEGKDLLMARESDILGIL